MKDLHLAVCMFDMPGNQINQNKRATKRKLSLPATQLQGINTEIKLDSDYDEDERYQRYVEQFEKDTKPGNKKKQDNSEWNETDMVLIRHLKKKGTRHRFGAQHLILWTDLIVQGRLTGPDEERVTTKRRPKMQDPHMFTTIGSNYS